MIEIAIMRSYTWAGATGGTCEHIYSVDDISTPEELAEYIKRLLSDNNLSFETEDVYTDTDRSVLGDEYLKLYFGSWTHYIVIFNWEKISTEYPNFRVELEEALVNG